MSFWADTIRSIRTPRTSAVIVAAGSGERFGGDKLYAELGGAPVLAQTLMAFEKAQCIDEIILVVRRDAMQEAGELCRQYGLTKLSLIVPGGPTRLLSSYAGVMSVTDKTDVIAIHDGARPLVSQEIIEKSVWEAYRHGAVAPAVPVRDTIKRAEKNVVLETPDRSALFAVQTPQCFERDLIRGALSDAVKKAPELTDDCAAVERVGGQIWLSAGSEENIKITTPLDLELAEVIWKRRHEA